jgi:hypothetical protein
MLAWFRLLVAMAAAVSTGPALADWRVSSGSSATILFEQVDDGRATVVFGCANGIFSFGVNSNVLGPLPEEEGEAYLSIRIDDGLRWESSAVYRRTAAGGFDAVYLASEDLAAIIDEIIAAESTIVVELQHMLYGERFTWTAGATGSTRAGRELVATCGIAVPTPIPAAVGSEPTWKTTIEPDTVNGGEQASLLGYLESNAFLLAYCDGSGANSLSLLATELPHEVGAVGLNLHVEIDGESRMATGEYFSLDNGVSGVSYTGDYVASTIKALAGARSSIRMKVQDYSDGSMREWGALDLAGLSSATEAFNARCFGAKPVAAETPSAASPDPFGSVAEPGKSWSVESGSDVSVPGAGAVLVGVTSPATGYLQFTCSPDAATWSIGFASGDSASFPVGSNDGPFKVIIDNGSHLWEFDDGRYEVSGARTSIVSSTGADVPGFLATLTLQLDPMVLTLVTAGGANHSYTLGTDGLGEASAAMFETCYGLRP